ncbi:hypothetical protein V6N11_075359 [Hibiscus sabdariffa]|uniref:Uncharacterized protein n=1 Tax=Hibiscus sabdariffa TaxID=183260 RepID=A0ABR2R6Z6_9ROSI
MRDDKNCDVLFGVIVWKLCLSQNLIVFENSDEGYESILEQSCWMVDHILQALESRRSNLGGGRSKLSSPCQWSLPKLDWVELNTNGARRALSQLLEPNNMVGNGVKKQIEKKSGGDEKRIVLVLHDGFLVTEMLGRSARIGFAAGAGLIFLVYTHKKEETKGDH